MAISFSTYSPNKLNTVHFTSYLSVVLCVISYVHLPRGPKIETRGWGHALKELQKSKAPPMPTKTSPTKLVLTAPSTKGKRDIGKFNASQINGG